jgi:hypothetical protein
VAERRRRFRRFEFFFFLKLDGLSFYTGRRAAAAFRVGERRGEEWMVLGWASLALSGPLLGPLLH